MHRQHGVARYAGVTTRTVGGTARDYLVLEYRGADRLYLPVDQIDAVTPYSGGESPTLSRMGGADWQRTRAKARAAAGEIAEELVALYRRRLAVEGHAFAPDTPWQAELEASFPYVETADQLAGHRRGEGRHGAAPRPWTAWSAATSGFGKTEVAVAGRLQGGPGRQAGGGAGADHPAGQPALPDLRRPLRAASRCGSSCSAGSSRPPRPRRWSRAWPTARSTWSSGTHRLLAGGHRLQGPRAAGGRRGAALRGHPQGGGQADRRGHRRAHPHRQPHPADPGDGPHRDPRPLHGEHPAGRPPPDPHLRGGVRRRGGVRGPPPRAAARGPGLLRPQPGGRHRRRGPPAGRPGARGPDRRGPRPDGRGQPRAGRARLLGAPLRRAGLHHHHRVGHRHADGEHPGRRPGRPARPGPAAPAAGPGRPGQPAGLRLPLPPGRPGPHRAGLRAAAHHRRAHRARLGVQDRHARPRDPGGGQPARAPTSPATSPPSATTSTSSWWPRRWPRPGASRAPTPPTVSLDVPGDAHLPAAYVAGRGRPARGLPPAGGGHRHRATSTTWPTSGPTATARRPRPPRGCWPWPGCGWPACAPGSPTWRWCRPGPAGPATRRPGISPLALAASAQVRLRRLAPEARYREELHQLVVPLPATGRPADDLCGPCWTSWCPRPRRHRPGPGRGAGGADSGRRRHQPVACPAHEATRRLSSWSGGRRRGRGRPVRRPLHGATVNGIGHQPASAQRRPHGHRREHRPTSATRGRHRAGRRQHGRRLPGPRRRGRARAEPPTSFNNNFVRYWLGDAHEQRARRPGAGRPGITVTATDLAVGRLTFTSQIKRALASSRASRAAAAARPPQAAGRAAPRVRRRAGPDPGRAGRALAPAWPATGSRQVRWRVYFSSWVSTPSG